MIRIVVFDVFNGAAAYRRYAVNQPLAGNFDLVVGIRKRQVCFTKAASQDYVSTLMHNIERVGVERNSLTTRGRNITGTVNTIINLDAVDVRC